MTMMWMDSPVGTLSLVSRDGKLAKVHFGKLDDEELGEDAILRRTRNQLEEYFAGKRTRFDLPLGAEGTEFELKVWRALSEIPYGETTSYGEIARRVDSPKAVRAVGRANGKNPIAIIVPCHRVIGSNNTLTGYGGGLPNKRYLLDLEAHSAGYVLLRTAPVAGS